MNLSNAIKIIKDTFNSGVKLSDNSFEEAIIVVIESVGHTGYGTFIING